MLHGELSRYFLGASSYWLNFSVKMSLSRVACALQPCRTHMRSRYILVACTIIEYL